MGVMPVLQANKIGGSLSKRGRHSEQIYTRTFPVKSFLKTPRYQGSLADEAGGVHLKPNHDHFAADTLNQSSKSQTLFSKLSFRPLDRFNLDRPDIFLSFMSVTGRER